MYDYIYIYFFHYFRWRSDEDPKDSAIYGVMFAVFIHFFFLVTSFNFFSQINVLEFIFDKGQSKYAVLPLVLVMMFIVHRIYKKRSDKIIERFADRRVLGWTSTFVIILIIVVPLVSGIYFIKNS